MQEEGLVGAAARGLYCADLSLLAGDIVESAGFSKKSGTTSRSFPDLGVTSESMF